MLQQDAVSGWRSPKIVLLVACVIMIVTLGVRSSFALFLEPIGQALASGRGVFGLAIALQNLVWGVTQPFAGYVADRYGSGRVIALGGLSFGGGILVMAEASDPLTLNIGAGLLVGFGLATGSLSIVLAAVARIFPESRRSWALGVVTAAGSLGQVLLVPSAKVLIDDFGWSLALVILGVGAFVVVPLASALTGRAVQSMPAADDQNIRQALGEAWASSGFRYLTAGFFVCGFHVTFIGTHLPAYVVDVGLSADLGAWALGVIGLFNIIGAYTAGVLGGRLSKKRILSAIYVARAVVFAVFLMVPVSAVTVLIFAAVVGLLWLSTVPVTSALVAQVFGPRYMATLFGIVFLGHQIGGFLGAWLGGLLYDETGSYDVIWWASVALGLLSALIHWPIDERPLRPAPTLA